MLSTACIIDSDDDDTVDVSCNSQGKCDVNTRVCTCNNGFTGTDCSKSGKPKIQQTKIAITKI